MAASPYQIEAEKVDLSFNWGLTACDYKYQDVNRVSGKFETVKVDFQDLMVRVGSRRAVVVEGEITPMTIRMRDRNTYISKLGEILSVLTKAQAGFTGDDSGSKETTLSIDEEQYNMLMRLKAVSEGGMVWKSGSSYKTTKANLEGLVQAVKSEMDKENNASQTDMTRLQSLVDRRDDSYSTATNIMSAISDTRANLIQNL